MKATVSACLLQQWTSVTEDFSRLSMEVSQAVKELQNPGAPPSAILVEALMTARRQFADFSIKVLSLARMMAIAPLPTADTIASLHELRTLLDMIAEAEGKTIAEDLRSRALGVLERVTHEQTPGRFEPDNTAQKMATALLNEIVKDRPGLLCDLTWRLLYEDKLSLAFHLAQSLETQSPDGQLRLPSWLIQAATLSRYIRHAHGEIARLLKQGFDQFYDADVTTRNDEWNHGIKLLAVAAALQPALSAPQAGSAAVLRAVCLGEHLSQLSAYCRAIADYADKNQPLDPAIFKKGKGRQATWQAEIDALKQATESWWVRASRMTMVYPPATRVWAKWAEPKGLLAGLLAPVRTNDASKLQAAKRSIEQLSDDAQIKQEVDRTDREVLGRLLGDDIPTKALDQIRLHLREAGGFVRRWIELQELRGRGKDAAQEQAEQLRRMVWSCQEVVLEEVNFFKRRHPSLWVAAGVACCRRALEQVRTLFDPQATFPTEEPLPRPLLYADLLRIPLLPLNDQWEPEVADRTVIIDGILELLAGRSAKKVTAEV